MPGFDWAKWLPLIIGGAGTAAGIVGGVKQGQATDKAIEYNAQAAKDALALMAGMFALEYGNKSPYRAAGTAALPKLMGMSGLDGSKLPLTPDQGAPMSKSLADIFRSANIPVPAGAGGSGGGGGLGAALAGQPKFDDISTKGIHSRLGGVVGGALGGFGAGSMAAGVEKAFLGPALSAALGPATLGIAPAVGAIAGLFDNNNSDKDFASTGINRVSDWTWKTLMPAVKAGQISPQDAEAAFNEVWGKWEGSMRGTKSFNSGVADKSIASQRQYFQPFFDQINQFKQGQQGVA
jgi:hypothetical protein